MNENEKYALILVSNGNLACIGVGTSEDMDSILTTMYSINDTYNIHKICVLDTMNIDVNTPSNQLTEAVGSLIFT